MNMEVQGTALTAPFPWFGGKSRVASQVWERFGDVDTYIEPFFGSGAVLLGRPRSRGVEHVNDADGFVANFWRAMQAAPDEVAGHADWPINECDLHARHLWLVEQRERITARLHGDPEWYDAKVAGWWVWGISIWIGSGFCSGRGPWRSVDGELRKAGEGTGVRRQAPVAHAQGVSRRRPVYGEKGVHRRGNGLDELFAALSDRLRHVHVLVGDWSRVVTPVHLTTRPGVCAIFLDPPYSAEAGRDMRIYAVDCGRVAHEVREWALAHGDDPRLRIALCGYDGEHEMPDAWERVEWGANASRERIWFSPSCRRTGMLWAAGNGGGSR